MIEEFLIFFIKSKLNEFPSLVLYDKEQLYTVLLPALKAEGITIFDTSESILSVREDALDYYNQILPAKKDARMIPTKMDFMYYLIIFEMLYASNILANFYPNGSFLQPPATSHARLGLVAF